MTQELEQMDRLIEMIEGHGTTAPLVLPGLGEPPEPGTDAYKALPATEKAEARAYHAKVPA